MARMIYIYTHYSLVRLIRVKILDHFKAMAEQLPFFYLVLFLTLIGCIISSYP